MLAGVRGIKPRPVGFKFHAVLVVNSAHLASLAAQDRDRWLPLFWALDNFKSSQARNRAESDDWVMPPIRRRASARAAQAGDRFREAMDNWDEEAADRAIAGWAAHGRGQRDLRSFLALRGPRFPRHRPQGDLRRQLLSHAANHRLASRRAGAAFAGLRPARARRDQPGPARRRRRIVPGARTCKRVGRIRADWQRGRVSSEATAGIAGHAAHRHAGRRRANRSIAHAQSAGRSRSRSGTRCSSWPGELLMRQPGIVGLHYVTSINALHFAYQTSSNDETRRMMLLQAAAFLPHVPRRP